jgi:hypothetical protein
MQLKYQRGLDAQVAVNEAKRAHATEERRRVPSYDPPYPI